MKCRVGLLFGAVLTTVALSAQAMAQAPTTPPASPDRGGNTPVAPAGAPAGRGQGTPGTVLGAPVQRVRPAAYPTKQVDPEKASRGKALFGVTCSFCHGSDARGGEGGPNLIRSSLVLSDKDGELIAPVVQHGRIDRGMPKFDMTAAQVSDLAAYIHSFKVGGYDVSRNKPPSILVGNADAGKGVFAAKCASCHSLSGDLQGIGSRITDPMTLQQTWMMPMVGGGRMRQDGGAAKTHVPPTTVTVTLPTGEKVEGRLDRIDDFVLSMTSSEGQHRTFPIGPGTTVEIHDPLEPHRNLLPTYEDKDIHDLTAYLVTVK